MAQGLFGPENSPGEGQICRETVTGHLEETGNAARVRDDPVGHFWQRHPGPHRSHPDVAQKRPFEGSPDDPSFERTDDRARHGQEHLRGSVSAFDELEVRDVLDPQAELGGIPSRGERTTLSPPHDRPQLRHLMDLAQHLPQATVHLVAHCIVLLRAVVGDHRHRPIHFQANQVPVLLAEFAHGRDPVDELVDSPNGARPSWSRMGVKSGCTV